MQTHLEQSIFFFSPPDQNLYSQNLYCIFFWCRGRMWVPEQEWDVGAQSHGGAAFPLALPRSEISHSPSTPGSRSPFGQRAAEVRGAPCSPSWSSGPRCCPWVALGRPCQPCKVWARSFIPVSSICLVLEPSNFQKLCFPIKTFGGSQE